MSAGVGAAGVMSAEASPGVALDFLGGPDVGRGP